MNHNKKSQSPTSSLIYFITVILTITLLIIGTRINIFAKSTQDKNSDNGEGTSNANAGKMTIVIDPGHGGNDPGKVIESATATVNEKDINLAIALKLKTDLEAAGFTVVMTRDSDKGLGDPTSKNKKRSDMEKRMEAINSAGASYIISIHQNSYSTDKIKGAQVFYHEESPEGYLLADSIQRSLKTTVDPDNTREPQEGDDYYILKKSTCPGVIVECGFLSNPEECAKLQTEDYQTLVAKSICDGIAEYVKTK